MGCLLIDYTASTIQTKERRAARRQGEVSKFLIPAGLNRPKRRLHLVQGRTHDSLPAGVVTADFVAFQFERVFGQFRAASRLLLEQNRGEQPISETKIGDCPRVYHNGFTKVYQSQSTANHRDSV
jgi:hypothetical protein